MSATAAHVSRELRNAAAELLRRKRCRESLHAFALSIDIPTVPTPAMCPDESLVGPSANLMALHHAAILGVLERTMLRPFGRCLIMAPPGSAKSTYTSCVAPAWFMGKFPGAQIILTSYASTLAEKQSRRAQSIVKQEKYRQLWPEGPTLEKDSVKEWALSNKSEMMASGLLGGITGNRADGAIVDDPVSGREDADSEPMRKKTLDAYQDDLLSRLKPGAWLAFIMTRWHEQDLMGSILPDDYKGESGMVLCKDGLMWEVLNIPAKAERTDDPLGRKIGEYLWPEYMPAAHWQMSENATGPEAARKWASLYQQRPSPQGSGRFTREMINLYVAGELPVHLSYIGVGDYAVTAGGNDFTELAVGGVDSDDNLWFVDWWYEQCDTGKSVEETLNMAVRWKSRMSPRGVPVWYNEGGVIDKAVRPSMNRRQRDRKIYFDLRSIPSMQDKVAKVQSFIARASVGKVYMPKNAPWTERAILQLLALPAGRHDDAADVLGLFGRAIDQFAPAQLPPAEKPNGIRPFTQAWLEYEEQPAAQVRFR